MTKKNGKGGDYEVGYGKPPKHSRFKKGERRNPDGRPVGSKNKVSVDETSDMIRDEFHRTIDVKENGKLTSTLTIRAMTRRLLHTAMNGDVSATKVAFAIHDKNESRRLALKETIFNTAVDYKKRWAEEKKIRTLRGEPEPVIDPMSNPDNLRINYQTGEVTYNGLTVDEKNYLRMMNQLEAAQQWTILEILKDGPPTEYLDFVWDDLKHAVGWLAKFHKSLGASWPTEDPGSPDLDLLVEMEKRVMKKMGLKERKKNSSTQN